MARIFKKKAVKEAVMKPGEAAPEVLVDEVGGFRVVRNGNQFFVADLAGRRLSGPLSVTEAKKLLENLNR